MKKPSSKLIVIALAACLLVLLPTIQRRRR